MVAIFTPATNKLPCTRLPCKAGVPSERTRRTISRARKVRKLRWSRERAVPAAVVVAVAALVVVAAVVVAAAGAGKFVSAAAGVVGAGAAAGAAGAVGARARRCVALPREEVSTKTQPVRRDCLVRRYCQQNVQPPPPSAA